MTAPSAMLTPHFSKKELNYYAAPNATIRSNLEATARLLEVLRAAVGVPLRVTSGYRAPDRNQALTGASRTSQHLDGTAADVVPVGLPVPDAVNQWLALGLASEWGQVIVYPYGTHIHIGLPTRGRTGQVLAQVSPDSARPKYVPYTVPVFATAAKDAQARSVATGAVIAAAGGVAAILPKG